MNPSYQNAGHEDVAAGSDRHRVGVVQGAVLGRTLRPRQRPPAELSARLGVIEEVTLHFVGLEIVRVGRIRERSPGLLTTSGHAATRLMTEHHHLAVPREDAGV